MSTTNSFPPQARPYSQQAPPAASVQPLSIITPATLSTPVTTAIVYCEGNFASPDGKTANGLVRHSEKYKILSIIDSEKAGLDAGMVLDDKANAIPICRDLDDSLAQADEVPNTFIFGMAPASGMLSPHERGVVLEAMELGMNIVNGLHEFLNDDPVFAAASVANNVTILDIRKPPAKKDLRMFSGRIAEVTCPCIAVLGTDGAIAFDRGGALSLSPLDTGAVDLERSGRGRPSGSTGAQLYQPSQCGVRARNAGRTTCGAAGH